MTEGTDKPAAAAESLEGQAAAHVQQSPSEAQAESSPPQTSPVNGGGECGGAGDAEQPQTVAADEPEVSPPAEQQAPPAHEIPQGNGELVLVTDALSFVGAHVVSQLVQSGQFRVRAAVSDVADEAKVGAVKGLSPAEAKYPLDVVEAGSTAKPEAWEAALKDCEFVISTSCHQNGAATADDAAVQAAVDATLAVLKAAHSAKTVKRVVLTSSISAITQGHGDSKKRFTEEDWSEAEKTLDSEAKIETLVEKAAWAFVKDLPDNERFELVAINPGYVLGPPLVVPSESSVEVVRRLLNRDDRMLPKLNFNVVDVRDVALAHVRALTLPVAGARHILVSHNVWLRDIAVILAKEFKRQGFSVPTTQAPYLVLWMKAQFDPSIKSILPLVNHLHETDTKRMKEALYIQPRDLKETVIDTASSLIEKDVVKKVEKKPSRRFSLRRSKKEPKEESKTADGEQPAADVTEAAAGGGAAEGGAEEKSDKKKKAASPKKKSDKKKKGAAAATETATTTDDAAAAATSAAAAAAAAAAEPAPAEATTQPSSEEPPTAGAEAGEGPAVTAGDQHTAQDAHQHPAVPNGDVCQETKVASDEAAAAAAPAASPVAEPAAVAETTPSGDSAAAESDSAPVGTAAATTAAVEEPAAEAAAAQEEPAAVTAC